MVPGLVAVYLEWCLDKWLYIWNGAWISGCISGMVPGLVAVYLRVHAQTIYYQESLAFCFQLCTVAHSLAICRSLSFLVPWFSSLIDKQIWRILCVMYGEEGGGRDFVCLFAKTISHCH